jgi:branched-chain amino acid transport system substrate-binding protein
MGTRTSRITTTVVGVLAVVSLVLTGCSSSKSTGSSGSAAASSPIVIGTEIPLSGQIVVVPEFKAGTEAAVSAVNAAGGVKGHPLQLKVCDTKFDANTELSCMRSFISAKVTAVAGGIIAADPSGREAELAAKAGIPYVASYGGVPAEYTTPGIFPISCGFPGWVYGGTKNLVAKGATKVGVISLNNAAGLYGVKLADAALADLGMKATTTTVADPQSDPTFSTAAAKAVSNGVDGIFITLTPLLMPKLLTALKNAGYNGRIATLSALATPATIKAAGSAAEGVLVTAQAAFPTDTTAPAMKAFLGDMKKYQPDSAIDENAIRGWSAIMLFAKVMSGASAGDRTAAPTSAQVLAAFNGITTPIESGTFGPFGPPAAKPYVAGFDRMFSPWIQNGVVKDGVVRPDGNGFVNPFVKK